MLKKRCFSRKKCKKNEKKSDFYKIYKKRQKRVKKSSTKSSFLGHFSDPLFEGFGQKLKIRKVFFIESIIFFFLWEGARGHFFGVQKGVKKKV